MVQAMHRIVTVLSDSDHSDLILFRHLMSCNTCSGLFVRSVLDVGLLMISRHSILIQSNLMAVLCDCSLSYTSLYLFQDISHIL